MATITKSAATAAKPELKENEKLPVIVPDKKEQSKKLHSIEARLKKLDEINNLADRRKVVADAIENLGGFYISPDGNGCNLRLQDSKGKTFAIAHPSVIGEMVAMAKAKLTAELTRIENLIDFTI